MIGWVLSAGMLLGLGAYFVYVGMRRGPIALGDALALLDGQEPVSEVAVPIATTRLENAGSWVHNRLRLSVTSRQRHMLLIQDRSVSDFFAERLIWAAAGFTLPLLWLGLRIGLGEAVTWIPMGLSLIGGISGYLLAGARLHAQHGTARRATVESLHTFFDLVALERLANQSATQAVTSAAKISDAPLFRRISAGLDRARMEQRAPWEELRSIAKAWQVDELADFADVMQLEEQGAALADVLQARVRELRDAHLTQQRADAQEDTERLAIWMTIPALLLGAAFITAPLLKFAGL